jgi:hypothetical protein
MSLFDFLTSCKEFNVDPCNIHTTWQWTHSGERLRMCEIIKQRRISFVLGYLRMILWKISTAISIKHRLLTTFNIKKTCTAQWPYLRKGQRSHMSFIKKYKCMKKKYLRQDYDMKFLIKMFIWRLTRERLLWQRGLQTYEFYLCSDNDFLFIFYRSVMHLSIVFTHLCSNSCHI